jgi:hypothetical protein
MPWRAAQTLQAVARGSGRRSSATRSAFVVAAPPEVDERRDGGTESRAPRSVSRDGPRASAVLRLRATKRTLLQRRAARPQRRERGEEEVSQW